MPTSLNRIARRAFTHAAAAMCALAAGIGSAPALAAESFPSRALRILVPAAAGGNLDMVTRSVAQKLSEQLGQPVVVENRPGGNHMISVEALMRAPADGYTYLAIADSFLYTPAVVKQATFDPIKDFVNVGIVARVPMVLVTHPSVSAKSASELIALAKRSPGNLTYGTSGTGSTGHIAAELFSALAGIRMVHVPYKGNAPALIDVMGGRTSLMFDPISTSMQHIKAGKLKALGVTSRTRSSLLADLPTVSESGLPGYEASIFNGFVARAGTPPEIVTRLKAELRKIVQQPDFRSRLLEQGVEPVVSESPAELAASMKTLMDKYVQIVRQANIGAD